MHTSLRTYRALEGLATLPRPPRLGLLPWEPQLREPPPPSPQHA